MMRKFKAGVLLLSIACTANVLAAGFSCKPYYSQLSNTLGGVTIFNAEYIGDKHAAELAPASEAQQGNVIKQLWQLTPYRDSKLFVTCIYEDNGATTQEIPQTVNTCELKFIDEEKIKNPTIKPVFHCFKQ